MKGARVSNVSYRHYDTGHSWCVQVSPPLGAGCYFSRYERLLLFSVDWGLVVITLSIKRRIFSETSSQSPRSRPTRVGVQ